MKASELRTKSVAELTAEIAALQKEAFNLRMQKSRGEAPRPHDFRLLRRKVARIKTILIEKKREAHE